MDVSQTPGQSDSTMDESSELMNRDLKAECLAALEKGTLLRCRATSSPMEAPLVRQLVELSGLPEEFIEAELVPSLPTPQVDASGRPITSLDDLRTAMLELLDRMNEEMTSGEWRD